MCILNEVTSFSGVEKRSTLSLFLTYGTEKKSFGDKSGPEMGFDASNLIIHVTCRQWVSNASNIVVDNKTILKHFTRSSE